jgi:4-hydroxy-2-oxoheptanedioate aldolase
VRYHGYIFAIIDESCFEYFTAFQPTFQYQENEIAMKSHSLLNAFKSNTSAFGAWVTLPGTFLARSVALASPHLSWIVIDCEHGLVPLIPDVAEIIAVTNNIRKQPGDLPLSTLVRIPATGVSNSSSWQIKHALDAGARGVVIPLV